MNEDSDALPTVDQHRGVPLHAFQSEARFEVVRADIDRVFQEGDIAALARFADDVANAPEARLLAAAKTQALWDTAVEERIERPDVDLELVAASVAGLDSTDWANPDYYCSDFDSPDMAVKRDEPLADD